MPPDPYSAHSETVKAVVAHVCRRHRLTADQGDDFRSWVNLKLIDNDQAILRKFREQSSIRTYLITVVLRLFLDWRIHGWGRWRPTTLARKLGPVAIELERLVLRDGHPYEEAVETLISKGVVVSRHECDATWGQLRRAPRTRVTPAEMVPDVPSTTDPFASVDFEVPERKVLRLDNTLRQALRCLDHQEQILLRLKFLDEFTAKEMAERMGGESKPLYRRIEQIEKKLAGILADAGLTAEEALAVFRNPDIDLGEILDEELRKPKDGPSTDQNAGGDA